MANDLVEALGRLNRNPSFAVRQLSQGTRGRLLKWYNGNPFDSQEATLRHALKVLQWCEENSDIFEWPADMRLASVEAGSEALGISAECLTDLMVNSNTLVLQPSATTRLIAFEGIDNTEIMRQMDLLQTFLIQRSLRVTSISVSHSDHETFFGREIARLQSGKDILPEEHLDPKSMALWYALDRKVSLSQRWKQPANSFVLLTRYTLSSIVHEWVRSNVDLADWIFQLEHTYLGIPAPDLYIVLDIPPSFAEANANMHGNSGTRITANQASSEYLSVARRRYREIANRFPQIQSIDCTVDAHRMKTPQQIHAEILSCLNRFQFL